jgi:SAM-dependent methyltransferase
VNYGPASKYYDLFGSKDDVAFYQESALEHDGRALELGVGTGRVALELARAGVHVLGIDRSEFMLRVAREKLAQEPVSVRKRVVLRNADIRNFKLGTRFPFVYSPSATLEHCLTEKDRRNCFRCVFDHLKSNGVFVFDVSQLAMDSPASSWWIDRAEANSETEVVRSIFSKKNIESQVVHVNLFFDVYKKGRLIERYHEFGEAAIMAKEEVESMLKEVGFKLRAVYGDFNKSEYKKESSKIVFVAVKE